MNLTRQRSRARALPRPPTPHLTHPHAPRSTPAHADPGDAAAPTAPITYSGSRPPHEPPGDPEKPAFTYESQSGIGAGHSAMKLKLKRDVSVSKSGETATFSNAASGRFTFDSKSGVSGSPWSSKAVQAATQAAPPPPDESPLERIARGRAMMQVARNERYTVLLAPHLAAFAEDEIDEAELARAKAEARKVAEKELAARSKALDECEALLNSVAEADANVSKLSKKLEKAAAERAKAAGRLDEALSEVAV